MIVSELMIFPVKSLGGIGLNTMPYDALGPVGDRRYMLVNQTGEFISQRSHPRLSQVSLSLQQTDSELEPETLIEKGFCLSVPTCSEPLLLPLRGETEKDSLVLVKVWDDTFFAYKQQSAWATRISLVLSDYLSETVDLVYMDDSAQAESKRAVSSKYTPEDYLRPELNSDISSDISSDLNPENSTPRVGFADGFPSLIVNQASLDALNRSLASQGVEPISMRRFRPNIVLKAENGEVIEAFAEDSWKKLYNDRVMFDLVKPCSRCVMPTIKPETSEKQPAVWQALKNLNARDGVLYFGQNALHHFRDEAKRSVFGKICVGDGFRVEV